MAGNTGSQATVARRPIKKAIHDIHQQVWVLQGKSLIATSQNSGVTPGVSWTPLLSLHEMKGESLKLAFLPHLLVFPIKRLFLSIPQDKNVMDLYRSKETQKHFVLYRKETSSAGIPWITVESAACPGWFICTSDKVGEPVKMTKDSGKQNNTAFQLQAFPFLKVSNVITSLS
ncbi:interleukin-37-like [Sarcophilus harrisii]|uniref:interleukin-37-like n=1 Tax=Sarcophilus harrisii TaxID=9305 RepID=UPI0013019FAE|nr:interleukin-37-like [Sarcophilus harrisii]